MPISITGLIIGGMLFGWLVAFVDLAITLHRRDQLLEHLYTEKQEIWLALGAPRGWMWQPSRRKEGDAYRGFGELQFDWWSKQEPNWLKDIPEIVDDYRYIRRGIRRWASVTVPGFVLTILIAFLVLR